jgi:hypothetical protein
MTTWDGGADEVVSLLSRMQPKFLTKPTTGTMTNYYRDALGDTLTSDQTVTMDSKGRFDILRAANWHRATFSFTGDVEMSGLRTDIEADSDE